MSYEATGAASGVTRTSGGVTTVIREGGVTTEAGKALEAAKAAAASAAAVGGSSLPIIPIAIGLAAIGGLVWWRRRKKAGG